jgi:hypothetical protein
MTACTGKPHACTYKFHAIIMKGLQNISRLRRSIFKIKTKDDANPLFFTVCRFNRLQQSHTEFNTNTHTYQSYKNATFCFSNTHNTNSQQMNSVIPSSCTAPTYPASAPLGQSRNFWLAPCIVYMEHLNFKIIPSTHLKSWLQLYYENQRHPQSQRRSSPAFKPEQTQECAVASPTAGVLFTLMSTLSPADTILTNTISTAAYIFK